MKIMDGETASDIYAGTASKTWMESIGSFFGNIAANIGDWLGNIKIGDVRLADWYAADPLGAAAGVTLGGVVLYFGGKAVLGGINAGRSVIAAVRSLGVLGAARAGAGAVLRSIGSRAMYYLGHPGALASRLVMGITVGAVMRWVAGGAIRLLNFNWNMSDKELDAQVKAAQNSLWGVAGDTLGTVLGTALCGVIPGAAVVRVNPAKLAAIKEVNEELFDEVLPSVNSLVMATARVGQTKVFVEIYKNARRWLKGLSPVIKSIPFIGPIIAGWLDKWGAPDAKPWTINGAIESAIESIPDEGIRNFFENLWEQLVDSCTESVFVLSTAFG